MSRASPDLEAPLLLVRNDGPPVKGPAGVAVQSKSQLAQQNPTRLSIDWSSTTGLRGLCAVQIMVGHFFFGMAPRSLRQVCNDPGVTDKAYAVIVAMDQPVALFFLLSGLLYGVLYYDKLDWIQPVFSSSSHDKNQPQQRPESTSSKKTNYEVWKTFTQRRFARLAPAWYVALLCMMPFYLPDENLRPQRTKVEGTLTAVTFLQSVLGPPDGFPHVIPPPHGPGWQISAFMLSYACLPPVFWLFKRLPDVALALLIVALFGVSLGVMQLCLYWIPIGFVHSFFFARFPNVMMGVALGMLAKRRVCPEKRTHQESFIWSAFDRMSILSTSLPTNKTSLVSEKRKWLLDGCFAIYVCYNAGYVPLTHYDGDIWLQFYLLPLYCVWLWWLVVVVDNTKGKEILEPPQRSSAMITSGGEKNSTSYSSTISEQAQAARKPTVVETVLTSECLQTTGDWSYVLYCFHWPTYYFATWLLSGFSTEFIWHRCLILAQGNGCFGMEYWHLPIAVGLCFCFSGFFSIYVEDRIRKKIDAVLG
ncbi:unnamed protein product [Amoebophrya sp. A120]|nr:unnamed protein product [Amoebophrya sp. A120]|eukprot:GSA120T00001599001.1